MTQKYQHEDDYYEKLIKETNIAGNQLLAHLVAEKTNEKNEKISQINFCSEYKTYKSELEKLKSLKVAFIHKILNEKDLSELDLHVEEAERILAQIEKIFNDHIRHNASGVISKKELEELRNNNSILENLQSDLKDIPDNNAAPYIKTIEDFQTTINQILKIIETTASFVQDAQANVLRGTSNVVDCL